MDIGEILKRLRLIYGYKAYEMSEELNISPSYLSEIEHGNRAPSLELLQNYATILDIKLSVLILLSEEYSDMKQQDKTELFIRKKLLKLIDKCSKGLVDIEEDEDKV